ncbi:anthranilate synthase component I [Thermosulfuriphilus sp.]
MSHYVPDLKTFLQLAQKFNYIPVWREVLVDFETPISLFHKLATGPYAFLLESLEGGEKWGRYSFIGLSPALIFRSRGQTVSILDLNGERRLEDVNPLKALRGIFAQIKVAHFPELPRFFGGAVGFLGYDMVRFMERLPEELPDEMGFWESHFMFPEILLVHDNLRHSLFIIYGARVADPQLAEAVYKKAVSEIEATLRRLKAPLIYPSPEKSKARTVLTPEIPKERFEKMVKQAKEYIRAGDIIQVVLSQRFSGQSHLRSFDLYRALRKINPSPYLFFLRLGDETLIGSSPEILVRLEGKRIEVRPIAGTRPRGQSQEEDEILAADLLADPKERAEHLMLVDLGRNDVGRVAKFGSVRVYELMVIERYSHVMHLVSGVEGELAEGYDMFDVLSACFPAGTVTGAPKIRAMEIIEELEASRRGPYAGAVGYFGFSGNMDFCITIRTLFQKADRLYLQTGAGIVADSIPEREYLETINKGKGMLKAIELAQTDLS